MVEAHRNRTRVDNRIVLPSQVSADARYFRLDEQAARQLGVRRQVHCDWCIGDDRIRCACKRWYAQFENQFWRWAARKQAMRASSLWSRRKREERRRKRQLPRRSTIEIPRLSR